MDKIITDDKSFQTKDYCLAAALIASGQKLQKLKWRGTVAFFVFDKLIECSDLTQSYKNNNLSVKAWDFTLALKEVKLRLYARKEY